MTQLNYEEARERERNINQTEKEDAADADLQMPGHLQVVED
jgi:3,4-dihydroxy-2-butanone 4-phosphate synthase